MNINDYIGKKFGRWTVLSEGKIIKYKYNKILYVNCICDCGKMGEIELNSLKRRKSNSCGCLNIEVTSKRFRKHGFSMISKTEKNPDYAIWLKMKSRCLNSNDESYKHYGGRGIKICEKWMNFEGFLEDMGWRPSKNYSIERNNVNGNYEMDNCRWIPKSEQSRNTRRVKMIKYMEKERCLTEWCKELNLVYSTMRHRVYDLNIPFEEALKYPQHAKLKKRL